MAAVDESWFGEPSVLAVQEWLQSSEGQAMITKTLRGYRLGATFDADVERMVLQSAAGAISRGKTIDSPPAWATNCLRNRAKDLFRSPISKRAPRRERQNDDAPADEAGLKPHLDDDTVEQFENNLVADQVRRQLLRSATHGWRVAAGLAVLAYDVDQAQPSSRCPRPEAGAGELESSNWAGLWYAGKHECFEDDGAAVRQRRSRASREFRHALAESGRTVGLREVPDD